MEKHSKIVIVGLVISALATLSACGSGGTTAIITTEKPVTRDLDTTDPVTPEPDTTDPVTPEPDTTDPVTPEPVTPESETTEPDPTDSDTPDPVTPDPDTPDPDTPDPVTPESDTTESDTTDPVTPDPDTPDPVTTDPVTPDPDTTDPVTPDPDTPDPDTTDPVTPDTETTESETTEPDPTESETTEPDPTESEDPTESVTPEPSHTYASNVTDTIAKRATMAVASKETVVLLPANSKDLNYGSGDPTVSDDGAANISLIYARIAGTNVVGAVRLETGGGSFTFGLDELERQGTEFVKRNSDDEYVTAIWTAIGGNWDDYANGIGDYQFMIPVGWYMDNNGDGGSITRGHAVIGHETTAATVRARSGTASYSGHLKGNSATAKSTERLRANADVRLNVDFAEAKINNGEIMTLGEGEGHRYPRGTKIAIGASAISGNGFDSSLLCGAAQCAGGAIAAGSSFAGRFYGDAAQEAGGTASWSWQRGASSDNDVENHTVGAVWAASESKPVTPEPATYASNVTDTIAARATMAVASAEAVDLPANSKDLNYSLGDPTVSDDAANISLTYGNSDIDTNAVNSIKLETGGGSFTFRRGELEFDGTQFVKRNSDGEYVTGIWTTGGHWDGYANGTGDYQFMIPVGWYMDNNGDGSSTTQGYAVIGHETAAATVSARSGTANYSGSIIGHSVTAAESTRYGLGVYADVRLNVDFGEAKINNGEIMTLGEGEGHRYPLGTRIAIGASAISGNGFDSSLSCVAAQCAGGAIAAGSSFAGRFYGNDAQEAGGSASWSWQRGTSSDNDVENHIVGAVWAASEDE